MLRKRTRSLEKDQQKGNLQKMSHSGTESYNLYSENHKSNPLFSVPGLFIGLNHKGLSDSDSVRSPTSPLDLRVSSILGNPLRSPRSTHTNHGQQRSWNTSKVGLRIIDTIDDNAKLSGKIFRSESKNILFGPQIRIKNPNSQTRVDYFQAPKSLPENYAIFPYTHIKSSLQKGNSDVVFEIGETPLEPDPFGKTRSLSLDSCRPFSGLASFGNRSLHLSSGSSGLEKLGGSLNSNNFLSTKLDSKMVSTSSCDEFVESLSASEIELSEDYTRVISHGPNPKTTHIFGEQILDCNANNLRDSGKNDAMEIKGGSTLKTPYNAGTFLSSCYSCNKKLEGRDIYIYGGEKAFCSLDCRMQEILIDEVTEKTIGKSSSDNSLNMDDNGEELSKTSVFIAT